MLHLRGQYTLKNKKYKINQKFDVNVSYASPNRKTKSFVNTCKGYLADEIKQEIAEYLLDNFWVNEYEDIRELSKCSPCVEDIKWKNL